MNECGRKLDMRRVNKLASPVIYCYDAICDRERLHPGAHAMGWDHKWSDDWCVQPEDQHG